MWREKEGEIYSQTGVIEFRESFVGKMGGKPWERARERQRKRLKR
jgi:hypothetical protein